MSMIVTYDEADGLIRHLIDSESVVCPDHAAQANEWLGDISEGINWKSE